MPCISTRPSTMNILTYSRNGLTSFLTPSPSIIVNRALSPLFVVYEQDQHGHPKLSLKNKFKGIRNYPLKLLSKAQRIGYILFFNISGEGVEIRDIIYNHFR